MPSTKASRTGLPADETKHTESTVPATSAYPVAITHDMIGTKANFERYSVGDTFDVVYLPSRSFEQEFGEFVRDYQPIYQILLAIFAAICGTWMTLKGWRMRRLVTV